MMSQLALDIPDAPGNFPLDLHETLHHASAYRNIKGLRESELLSLVQHMVVRFRSGPRRAKADVCT